MEQLRENLHLKARLAEHLARCLQRPLSRWLLLQLAWGAMELEEGEVAGVLAKKELRHREAQVVLTKLVMLDHVEQQEETRGGSCAACNCTGDTGEERKKKEKIRNRLRLLNCTTYIKNCSSPLSLHNAIKSFRKN